MHNHCNMSLLTRHGYIIDSEDFTDEYNDELTVIADKGPYYNNDVQPFTVYEDRYDGTLAVPRFWGEEHFGRTQGSFGYVQKANRLVFKGEMRPGVQQEAAEKTIEQLQKCGGGVLSLETGRGKTAIALYVACIMKVKTLVVVHKQFLTDQWENRIETFVPFAKIGRLQRDMEDVHDCDIVVGMLQSIAMREYDEDILQDFGLVIFDEVHVVPAPVFSRALLRLCAPYMLGLSATPVRRDGLSKVINWFLGPIFYEHSLAGKSEVTVEVVKFRLCRTLPMNIVAAINILCNMQHRNALILEKAQQLVSLGHKVMIISERRSHCEALRNELALVNIDGGLCYGGINNFELERSKEKAVLLGTYSYVKEGFDLPTLDAMILATPRSDVVQACGRVLRFQTSLSPTIIDVVDEWIIGKAQFNKRKIYYDKSGFSVNNTYSDT